MVRLIVVSLMVSFLSACQSAGLFVANLGNDTDQYVVERDIAYGSESWQKLDIYRSAQESVDGPAVVFIYGGSWSSGSKDGYGFVANRLVRAGYRVIIPDYVKYPQARYPAFEKDMAVMTRWLSDNLKKYHIQRDHIHLMGHSAGAHIGAMLIVDKSYLNAIGLAPDFYRSFVGLAGPYHFTPKAQKYKDIFGPPENYPNMQASPFIDGTEPPMFLITAQDDHLVASFNTKRLASAIEEKGGKVKTKNYPGLGHMTVIAGFSDSIPLGGDVVGDILTFMSSQ